MLCEAGLLGSFDARLSHPDKYACEILSPSTAGAGCEHTNACVFTNQDCPTGARCKLTTKLAWYDADERFNWSAVVQAAQDPAGRWGRWSHPRRVQTACPVRGYCSTGFDGDRCFASASITALGDGSPLWTGCSASLVAGGGVRGVSTHRDNSIRRIECDADLQIEPTAPLTMLGSGLALLLSTPSPGTIVATPTILTTGRLARAAATPCPRIARVRMNVTRRGAVTIPLKLNAAAKRLLRRKRKLLVAMRATFTADGAAPLTTTTLVTLRSPQSPPRICLVHRTSTRPKRPARCAARKQKGSP